MTKSYTFNGELDRSFDAWEQWTMDAFSICNVLGYEANYYDVSASDKNSGKARPIAGMQKKMANVKKKNDIITGISIMVLPENYSSAAFDYVICLSRNANYITCIINEEYKMNDDEVKIISILKRNIIASSGEIYTLDIYDCPEFYAAKAKSKESFKSLKVIKSLE